MDERQKQEIVDIVRDTLLEVLGQTQVIPQNTQKPTIKDITDDGKVIVEEIPKEKDLGIYKLRDNATPSSSVLPKKKKKVVKSNQQEDRSGKGSAAKVVPFDKNAKRPDLFVQLGFDEMCKEDVEIDKKLNAGRTPMRRGTRTTLVDATCSRCGNEYTVSNQLVRSIGGEIVFVCDRCIGRG